MSLGIFRTPRPEPHDGPIEDEPYIARRIAQVRASLVGMHHGDRQLAEARRALDDAMLEFRLATNHERSVESETALRSQAGRSARHQLADPNAAHLRADGARADVERARARAQREQAEQRAEQCNLQLQAVSGTLADRMLVEAVAAMPELHEHVALVNAERARAGLSPLPSLSADLPERLVLNACRRPGEPQPG